jgi:signal transduction histidine kinase
MVSDKESLFPSFFKLQKTPTFLVDPETLKILDVNDQACALVHSPASELKKKWLHALAPEKEQKKYKAQLDIHQNKELFTVDFPLKMSAKITQIFPATFQRIQKLNDAETSVFAVTIDIHAQEQRTLIKNIKEQNYQRVEQIKKMVDVNRKLLHSYESVKKQYEQLLQYQEENIKSERQNAIGNMVDFFQEKVNKPLTRILDDIQKINDTETKLSPNVVKRLKLIEESVENIMRVIGRISEVKDIKKMRYIELSKS